MVSNYLVYQSAKLWITPSGPASIYIRMSDSTIYDTEPELTVLLMRNPEWAAILGTDSLQPILCYKPEGMYLLDSWLNWFAVTTV